MPNLKRLLKDLGATDEQIKALLSIKLNKKQKAAFYEVFTVQLANLVRDQEEDLLRETAHAYCLAREQCKHTVLTALGMVLDVSPAMGDFRIRPSVFGENGGGKGP